MAAWLIAGLKTQTFGPNAATFASGQIDGAAFAAWDGTTASPAPAASAAAARTGRPRQRIAEPRVILFISATFAPQPVLRASPQGFSGISDSAPKEPQVSSARPEDA